MTAPAPAPAPAPAEGVPAGGAEGAEEIELAAFALGGWLRFERDLTGATG